MRLCTVQAEPCLDEMWALKARQVLDLVQAMRVVMYAPGSLSGNLMSRAVWWETAPHLLGSTSRRHPIASQNDIS